MEDHVAGKTKLIRAALAAYPGGDLMPADLQNDSLEQLIADARANNYGDILACFIALELDSGVDGEDWGRAVELIETARNDLDAVLTRLRRGVGNEPMG